MILDVNVSVDFIVSRPRLTAAAARALRLRDLPLSTRARNALFECARGWLLSYELDDTTLGQAYDGLKRGWKGTRVIINVRHVGPQTACEIRGVLLDALVPRWMIDDIAPALETE